MENAALSVFRPSSAVDGTEGWGNDNVSMLAEQGEMEPDAGRGVDRRVAPRPPVPAYPVATHPFKRLLDVLIAGFRAACCSCRCCWW